MAIDPLQLRQVSVFQNATDDDLQSLARHAIERSIEEGEFFFFQGDPAEYLYILVSGRAKLMQTNPAGQQVNLRTINEWQMFGALGAVRENATYPATAQALEHSTALAIRSDPEKVAFRHPLCRLLPGCPSVNGSGNIPVYTCHPGRLRVDGNHVEQIISPDYLSRLI